MSIRRPVPIVERFFLALEDSFRPERAECLVQQVVEGEGSLDPDLLQQAVHQASLANPGSRMVLRGALASLHWQVTDQTTPLRVIEHCDWSGKALDLSHPEFLFSAFDFLNGPTTEVVLIRAPVTRLIVRAHHAVMDGRGVMTFCEDIFRCLRGEAPLGSDLSVQYHDLAQRPAAKLDVPRAAVASLPGVAAAKPEDKFHCAWRQLSLDGRGALAKVAHALATATFAAHPGLDSVQFLMPADLRPLSPGLRSTANLASALSVRVRRQDMPDDIAADIRARVNAGEPAMLIWRPRWLLYLLSCLPIELLRMVLRGYRTLRRRGHIGFMYSASISNLGRFPLQQYTCESFAATTSFLAPPSMSTAAMMVMISGNDQHQHLLITSPDYALSATELDRVMEQLMSSITEPDKAL